MADHLTQQGQHRRFDHPALAQVGWIGHADRRVYGLDEHPSLTEPGGFSPLYIQVGTYLLDAESGQYFMED